MDDRDVLSGMAALAKDIGSFVRDRPAPPPFRTMGELREVFGSLDDELQARMMATLCSLRPQAGFAAELEGKGIATSGDVWIVDALDGAVQYLHGLTAWCVSVALVRDGEPVLAVLHSPALGETYTAMAGGGAARNGKSIAPSQKSELAAVYAATSQPPFVARHPDVTAQAGKSLSAALGKVGAVRNLGATSWQVADVAGGRIDAFWQYGKDDVNLLGAVLVAREGGARVTETTGTPWTIGAASILVAAPSIHAEMVELFAL